MPSAFPEVGPDIPVYRGVLEGSLPCLHVSVRIPREHPGLSPSHCDLCVLLQMVLHRASRGCHSARVTHPFTAEHQLFAPSVAPNCLGSSDVLFNKNLYHRMTDVFLLGIWIKRHRSPGTCAEDQSTVAAEPFHLKIQLAISLVLGGNHWGEKEPAQVI